MHDDILASRERVSRRRLLSVSGSVGLGALLAACGSSDGGGDTAVVTSPAGTEATVQPTTASSSGDALAALLDEASRCTLAVEETQGPYWFDVDAIRSDITEDRPGAELRLGVRVIDAANCDESGTPAVVRDAVVEVWHCDAGGSYSGFTAGAGGGPPGGGSGGEVSDGSYSEGVQEATPTDDSTFLRGAQVTNDEGIVRFTTIYPGWYSGRTVHIHLKVHIGKQNVLTTQLYFDDDLTDDIYAADPYSSRPNRDIRNDADSIYDGAGLLKVEAAGDGGGYLGAINLAIDA